MALNQNLNKMALNQDLNNYALNELALQERGDDIVFSSAARISTTTSADFAAKGFRGMRVFLDITAAAGTSPTLDVKVQVYDSLTSSYQDLPGASFAQKVGVGNALLTIYPGIAETANESVSDVIGSQYRVVATVGGTDPSFTFSVNASYLR